MYISRVELDYDNRRNLKKLSSLKTMHSYVEECFPDELDANERSRKLWRIDKLDEKTYLIIVSENKPDIRLLEKYGKINTAQTKNYDPFLEKIAAGKKARFKIVLNPTVSIKEEGRENQRGKIVPLKSSDFKKYLIDRSIKNGFKLLDEDFEVISRQIENFKHDKNNKSITLNRVTYQGILTITDKEKMIETLCKGIGKKKAYGFGLMTLMLES